MKNNDLKTIEHQDEENNVENLQISEQTREKLEDSTVSLFMDYYVKSLNVGIDIMMEECADDEFPEELDKRIRALIAKESAKERNALRRKTALRVLRSAAIVVIALLCACSTLFVTVEAFRIPIINLFINRTNFYWEISGNPILNSSPSILNLENPLGEIAPDDFSLISLEEAWEDNYLSALYRNDKGATIFFTVSNSYGILRIDTEEAFAKEVTILGHEGIISIEDNCVRISWIEEGYSRLFQICTTNLDESTAKNIAESVAKLFDE